MAFIPATETVIPHREAHWVIKCLPCNPSMFHNTALIEQILPTWQLCFWVPFFTSSLEHPCSAECCELSSCGLLSGAACSGNVFLSLLCSFLGPFPGHLAILSLSLQGHACPQTPRCCLYRSKGRLRVLTFQPPLGSDGVHQAGKWLHCWTFKTKLHLHC